MADVNKVPKIGWFAKSFSAIVLIVPIAAAIWMICNMSRQNEESRYGISVTSAALLLGALALVPNMLRANSTRFYNGGVEQVVLFSKGRFLSKVRLDWVSVETVVYKNFAYTMFARSVKVQVYLGCFYNLQETANFIHQNLPTDAVRK